MAALHGRCVIWMGEPLFPGTLRRCSIVISFEKGVLSPYPPLL